MTVSGGNNVLIVGGASGIGRKTCELLRPEKMQLIVADNDEEKLEQLAAEPDGKINILPMDLADPGSVSKALEWIENNIGRLDTAVISAAVHSAFPAEYLPDEHLEKIININLTRHIALVRDLLPLMNDGGKIIGISSNCADIGIPMESVYAASKAGMERFYEALSIELSYRKIRPVIIQPGNVNTGFNEKGNDYVPGGNPHVDDAYQKVVEAIDSKHGIDPRVVAQTIVDAMKSSQPRIRYIVGANAIKAHWAKRLLGSGFALKLLAKHFGI